MTGETIDRELWTSVRGSRDLSPRSVARRVLALVLWLLVCSSAVSGFLALVQVRALHEAPAAAPAIPAGLEGFAELSVSAFLEGSEATVRTFFTDAALSPVPGLMDTSQRFVARAAAVGIRRAGEAWRVTVGAEVLVAAEGGYRRDGTHWFEVSVSQDGDGYVAASLPSEVLAPDARSGS